MPSAMDAALIEALSGEMTPKFLATVGPEGAPNIVPVISLQPWDPATIVFGEYLMQKSRRNLEQNAKVGVLVVTEKLRAWSLSATFLGFQTSGEWFERVSCGSLLRYNAYTGIRAAGGLRVDSLGPALTYSQAQVLAGFLSGRAAAAALRTHLIVMPERVAEKYRRLRAIRAAAFVGPDGWPRVFPLMSCFAAGRGRLMARDRGWPAAPLAPAPGTGLAVAVLTFEPIAYQVKGVYAGRRFGMHVIDLDQAYSASPPLVGARLDAARERGGAPGIEAGRAPGRTGT
jgi:hypothetical protein